MSDRDWNHAGIGEVSDGESRSVQIPELVRSRGILSTGKPVYWSYERVVGVAVVSSSELEDDEYVSVDYRGLQDASNGYSCTVPARFFGDFKGRGDPKVSKPVPERARFEPGETVHLMFSEAMAESDPSSCYVLTDEEFNERFKDSDAWDGRLDEVPRLV
ncbi:MAG: hypothetical protein J07HQW1_00112 [Haloquadratum walsbyi J07HQW1]|jgi:hypothetical protein|uniref:Uncharacterized protein n=1 Tax=Haloquadratum walsbyi J07HQW1 TaxID=1238424 RepID=U1MKI4_9EURY|nr:MAG: hypothetical protein J07HQW1_00112 [Haloquadratum walsbyi J07HQW1]